MSSQPIAIIATSHDIARGVEALVAVCPIMAGAYKAAGMPPLRRNKPGIEGLCRIVVGQQVSVASAAAIWSRLACGIQPFTATSLNACSVADLQAFGLSRPKIRTLLGLSDAMLSGEFQLDGLNDLPDGAVHDQLTALSGIGPWTADVYTMFCLGRADAWAPGDLALQKAVANLTQSSERPNLQDMARVAEPWRPWRGVAARLLWAYYRTMRDGTSGQPV